MTVRCHKCQFENPADHPHRQRKARRLQALPPSEGTVLDPSDRKLDRHHQLREPGRRFVLLENCPASSFGEANISIFVGQRQLKLPF